MTKFNVRTEIIDITKGGLLDGRADTYRRFTTGMSAYYVDDVEVSPEEFSAAYAEASMA